MGATLQSGSSLIITGATFGDGEPAIYPEPDHAKSSHGGSAFRESSVTLAAQSPNLLLLEAPLEGRAAQ